MQVLIFLDEPEEEILKDYMKKNHYSSKNTAIKKIIRNIQNGGTQNV